MSNPRPSFLYPDEGQDESTGEWMYCRLKQIRNRSSVATSQPLGSLWLPGWDMPLYMGMQRLLLSIRVGCQPPMCGKWLQFDPGCQSFVVTEVLIEQFLEQRNWQWCRNAGTRSPMKYDSLIHGDFSELFVTQDITCITVPRCGGRCILLSCKAT
jgi:hypothetical protein